jgi:hypothetical protein
MTIHFKRATDEEIAIAVDGLDRCSFFGERDQCRTVEVGCSCCDKMFVEELGAAKQKLRQRRPFLCLACDQEASGLAFTGVTIKIGWFSD